jgi:hypothetical protein
MTILLYAKKVYAAWLELQWDSLKACLGINACNFRDVQQGM